MTTAAIPLRGLNCFNKVTDNIMVMYAGQAVEYGSAEQMIFHPVHPYSKGLMSSIIVPEKGTRNKRLYAIPGAPPNLKHIHSGCRFADRCALAKPQCREKDVPLRSTPEARQYRCVMDENDLLKVTQL